MLAAAKAKIAYFSMEVALNPAVPTYSGGLGVLAGDTLRAAADLGIPMIGVTLFYRKGYFKQSLDKAGHQTESPVEWDPTDKLELLDPIATVTIEGRPVHVRCWRYSVEGIAGHVVPVYLLDTSVATNSAEDQKITDHLYGGDNRYRLAQEMVLGIGGVEILSKLNHRDVERYHMNEGHSALLALRLTERRLSKNGHAVPTPADLTEIRKQCVFTTHTPVPAGHDEFKRGLVRQMLGDDRTRLLFATGFTEGEDLNMTHLALHHSNYINGVAMKHGEVSREMFPKYPVKAITNGIHAGTWMSPEMGKLMDRDIPEWRRDNLYLRYAIATELKDIQVAHRAAKKALFDEIKSELGVSLDLDTYTVGFARRATAYKRPGLFMSKPERLKQIAKTAGPIQIIYGGKAHPRDEEGKRNIEQIYASADALKQSVKVVYLPNYTWRWGALITAGVDVWLNTPIVTREASGTSGMKAALNGVPSLSTPDGWWIEGHLEGITGWSIDDNGNGEAGEVTSMYDKLEKAILPLYYKDPDGYAKVMQSSIALNGSFFNTQRMVLQYLFNAYATRDGPA
jgi:starch phosphorylase